MFATPLQWCKQLSKDKNKTNLIEKIKVTFIRQ